MRSHKVTKMRTREKIEEILFNDIHDRYPLPFDLSDDDIDRLIVTLGTSSNEKFDKKQVTDALRQTSIWSWHAFLCRSELSLEEQKDVLNLKRKCNALLDEIDKQQLKGKSRINIGDTHLLESKELQVAHDAVETLRDFIKIKQMDVDNYYTFVYEAALLFEFITERKFTSRNDSDDNALSSEGEYFVEAATNILINMEYAKECIYEQSRSNIFEVPFEAPRKRKILSTKIKTACRYARDLLAKSGQKK